MFHHRFNHVDPQTTPLQAETTLQLSFYIIRFEVAAGYILILHLLIYYLAHRTQLCKEVLYFEKVELNLTTFQSYIFFQCLSCTKKLFYAKILNGRNENIT